MSHNPSFWSVLPRKSTDSVDVLIIRPGLDNFFTTNNDMNVKPTVKTKNRSPKTKTVQSGNVTQDSKCSTCDEPCNVLHAEPPICNLCIETSGPELPPEIQSLLRNNFYTLKDKKDCVGCGKDCMQQTVLGCPKCKKPWCRKKATLKCNQCYDS